ncbi:carboxypeptidase M32 [Reinekea blandensis]|uniref:Metal-dependent carboxypeptidase n=1 Tax=Reinekea blandensis MED297 TaxID=314283 RepID=A4B9R3_9GAMM|nr:carboxypeptidase M32 [Reinekea blandensis]EAR11364.1 carboxypeptidase Taq [Reinekea sp. MED297] [Reinekea blandensis MED297]
MSYQKLTKTFHRLAQLEHAGAMLGWDQQVMMPAKGNEARGEALAELSVLSTEIIQQPALADAFAAAEADADNLEPWQQANLREMREQWKKANAIPADLVEAKALTTNECEYAWRSLRPANDWKSFEPKLKKVFDLCREEAQALHSALNDEKGYVNAYEALLDIYDPGTRLSRVDAVFAELKTELPALLPQVMEKQRADGLPAVQQAPVDKSHQIALAKDIMATLGFDFDAGRLDEAAHPFSGGVSTDSRITTRYSDTNVVEGLMGIIHETGHSRYETGLNPNWRGQPVGQSMGMGVHESQSLFFEMQMGRSAPFIDAIAPKVQQHLGNDPAFQAENLRKLYTQVQPGLIRVNADEVTYPMHVILRYEIERDVILGDAEVSDIPELWNQKMKDLLGLDTTGNYKDGPMQDVHWPAGAVGYFPSYTLGAMTAAQMHAAMVRAVPDAPERVARLDLKPIFAWLSDNVWLKGRSLNYDDLMIEATGETLNSRYFLEHIRSRYL